MSFFGVAILSGSNISSLAERDCRIEKWKKIIQKNLVKIFKLERFICLIDWCKTISNRSKRNLKNKQNAVAADWLIKEEN